MGPAPRRHDDGAALTCDEGRFRSLWGDGYELGYHADWRRLVLANEETGHMHSTVSKGQVLSMPFVSELLQDGDLKEDEVEELWADTAGESEYAEENKSARFWGAEKFARFWGAVTFEDEEPDEGGPGLSDESDELEPGGDESYTVATTAGGGRGAR